jgi:hypothetical protein
METPKNIAILAVALAAILKYEINKHRATENTRSSLIVLKPGLVSMDLNYALPAKTSQQ